ncbi:mesaconyl-C4 CoA hydratase [Exophiala aquamarina CBS 119918]|uniref:Mesaconyl-C4 CoA hydratase n=1 Tax=Exophiala aquamarina CBS 119918 TaxID=1182545 RepID=A0A072Q5V2_9EURO|nr:mesaconyl-C4 CoA hydratase [Exophiala aquamarina CBS 119918]KEF63275.1 mesaconyl-C4 CoA hydratase [Exophiala aquamarina CBS 119918]
MKTLIRTYPVHMRPSSSASSRLLVQHRKLSSSRHRSSAGDSRAVADAFLNKFSNGQTFIRRQLLDANQLRLFSLTLDRAHLWPSSTRSSKTLEEVEPPSGTPIPPGYHLIYFTPAQLPGILGRDGTDASFNPESPFTRRMWAGGSCHWPGAVPNSTPTLLRVGDIATEVTKVLSCEPKVIKKTGESMLVVGVEKEFRNGKDELCVLDRRNWVFRPELDPDKPASLVPKPPELSSADLDEAAKGKIVREYTRSEATLFRFSALTFNAHRIHYDKPWATEVEGHRNVVVHGPMNLIAILDLWRDESVSQDQGVESMARDNVLFPHSIEYRATNPVYAGEAYRVVMDEAAVGKRKAEVQIVSNDGTVCMKGTVNGW